MIKLISTFLFLLFSISLHAQLKIGDNPTTINQGSMLEIESTNSKKGLLLPRVGLTSTTTWGLDGTPAVGMIIYNTNTVGTAPNNVHPGFYYYDGAGWKRITNQLDLTSGNGSITSTDLTITGGTNATFGNVTADIADGAVTGSKVAASAITGDKIAQAGATSGQVLAWNGTTWAPVNDQGLTTGSGNITSTDLTITGGANATFGDVTANIAPGAITGDKIAQAGATLGQVLAWNGTTWAPVNDQGLTTGSGNITSTDLTITGGTNATFGNVTAEISNGAVTTLKLADGAVTSSKVAASAITGDKIAQAGATSGQVLAWNGTTWAPVNDQGLTTGSGNITSTDLTITGGTNATFGNVTAEISNGAVTTLKLADGAVTSSKVAASAITGDKIAQAGATSGQVLAWNGTTWAPVNDQGLTTGSGNITSTDLTITGGANATFGDVTANIAPGAITGDKIAQAGATSGQVLAWNGTTWAPVNDQGLTTGSGNITSTDLTITGGANATFGNVTAEISNGAVTTLKLADGAVTSSKVAASAITGDKIAQAGATSGQVLAWNGTTWAPVNDQGLTTGSGNITSTDLTITGGTNATFGNVTADIADGAVTGSKVAASAITGDKIAQAGATSGQVLAWNGTTWAPVNDQGLTTGSGNITSTDLTITGGANATFGDVTANIAPGAITGDKIAQAGATSGQVLAWNGTTWAPVNDQGLTTGSGNITSTDLTITGGTNATFGNVTADIADGAVTGSKVAASAITGDKIAQAGATSGQVLAWNGTTWAPVNDQGLTTGSGNITSTDLTITGGANATFGDVTANIAPGAITGDKIAQAGATSGQVLAWNGTTWAPVNDQGLTTGSGNITSTDLTITGGTNATFGNVTAEISNGAVTTLKLADGAVTSSKVAASAITGDKIAQAGATSGQVLAWNGTTWAPVNDQGLTTGSGNITSTDLTITGGTNATFGNVTADIADGAVTGSKVAASAITGDKIAQAGATSGQVLAWNGTTWAPVNDQGLTTGSGNITSTDLTITGGANATFGDVTANIAPGAITGDKIAQAGATSGQVLAWNGTTWAPVNDQGLTTGSGNITSTDLTITGGTNATFGNVTAEISNGAVTTLKLADGAVTSSKVAASAITGDKIAQAGATSGQVLAWNGTTWAPVNDQGLTTGSGNITSTDLTITGGANATFGDVTANIAPGAITGDKIAQAGATSGQVLAWNGTTWAPVNDQGLTTGSGNITSTDLTITGGTNATFGNVTAEISNGAVTTLKLADGAVTSSKVAASAITGDKIAQAGATSGQVLAWNGTTWAPVNDQGLTTGSGNITSTDLTITGGANATFGDVTANIAPGAITGDKIAQAGATSGQVLAWNGTTWAPVNDQGLTTGSGNITSTDLTITGGTNATFGNVTAEISNGAVTTLKLADGAVTSSKVAASAITGDKIAQAGATSGQVLAWNGTTWAPVNDQGLTTGSGNITSTDLTITGGTNATFGNVTADIADGAVTGSKVAASAITGDKIAQAGATSGQVLAWNGTTWAPVNDQGLTTGSGNITSTDLTITGGTNATFGNVTAEISNGAVTTLKLADGAVTSSKVAASAITGDKIAQAGATSGQVLAWNGTTWAPVNDQGLTTGSGNITSTDLTITGGTNATFGNVTADIADGAVTGSKVAASAITGDKIAQAGATSGQVLAWNGTTWAPVNDQGLTTGSGNITSTDLTITGGANATFGDVTANIAPGAITGDKIAQAGATSGQVLAWNGTTWVPVNVSVTGANNGLTLNGTNVQLGGTLLNATSINQNNNNLSFTGGNVGVGVASPAYTLDVSATANPMRIEGLQAGTSTDYFVTTDESSSVAKRRTVLDVRKDIVEPPSTAPFPGMIKYESNTLQYYDGSTWQILASNTYNARNEGVIKINSGNGAAQTQPSNVFSSSDASNGVERFFNYTSTLNYSSSTFWPENQTAYVDANIIGTYNGRTTFIENNIVGQVHTWRITGTYSRGGGGQIAWITFRLYNPSPSSTLSLLQYIPVQAQTTTGDFVVYFSTIGDNLSLPASLTAGGTGFGYHLVAKVDQPMTITITGVTRISYYKD